MIVLDSLSGLNLMVCGLSGSFWFTSLSVVLAFATMSLSVKLVSVELVVCLLKLISNCISDNFPHAITSACPGLVLHWATDA